MFVNNRVRLVSCCVVLLSSLNLLADEPLENRFVELLTPFCDPICGAADQFEWVGTVRTPIDGQEQLVTFRIARFDDEAFDLELTHKDYSLCIRRRQNGIAFALPHHRKVYLGEGEVDPENHLRLNGLLDRLDAIIVGNEAARQMLTSKNSQLIAGLIAIGSRPRVQEEHIYQIDDGQVTFDDDNLIVEHKQTLVHITRNEMSQPAALGDWELMTVEPLPRNEIEKQLFRGLRRATHVLSPQVVSSNQAERHTSHGSVTIAANNVRLCLLQGTPEQIGRAHGELLREEAQRCIDSVLYLFGTVQTIRTGRWFQHDLEDAYQKLAPHIPDRHKRETTALAEALRVKPELAQAVNIFPELFHCSGFAVFDSATVDGKLYHGRVLDYMTTIGLQDSSVTFIVKPENGIPFANIGYAGFIGSVSGMNAESISIGEMGGRGEGQWDGVPMATLMRRALEECSTLDEVKQLWTDSPRTCEYYYVFADGKTNQAVGVAATPESVQFVNPGEAHELLGEGIPDSVVLSAGSRLEELRKRVKENHGKIDTAKAIQLMSRPVAMQSNLHNVLFIPEDLVFHVANASKNKPAAEEPYTRYNLKELLDSMSNSPKVTDHPSLVTP